VLGRDSERSPPKHDPAPDAYNLNMCRSIKPLRHPDRPPTDQELHEAALQFVRKISGFRKPSRANQAAFDAAVADVAAAGRALFVRLSNRGTDRIPA
jgi:hypothetical protein